MAATNDQERFCITDKTWHTIILKIQNKRLKEDTPLHSSNGQNTQKAQYCGGLLCTSSRNRSRVEAHAARST